MALALAVPATASAATITVTNNNDSGPGSLRQAILSAAPGDTIVVPANTYTLTSGALAISESLTIVGAGASSTFIDGNGTGRVFDATGAPNPSSITISGVTIRDGNAPVIGHNVDGGGIASTYASLTLSDDIINGNSAVANGVGGGGAGGVADGGGVFSKYGTLTLIDTEVFANVASANGNSGQNGGVAGGGGVESDGPLVIEGCAFVNNVAAALGGTGATIGGVASGAGLYAGAGTIASTTFSGNTVNASGGPGGIGGIAEGGGLFDGSFGGASLVNVTATANAIQSSASGITTGGGLYYYSNGTPVTLTNSTVSNNTATGGNINQGGNAYLGGVNVQNTIIAAGAGDVGFQNCAGTPTSAGHNLDSLDQCDFHAAGDLVNTNPLLGALHDNGGPVQTMALLPGSPAIDAGSNIGCPPTDARGVLRPAGKACDIGAYEVPTATATTDPATATALNGVASNPDILAASAYFEYGNTTAYGLSTPVQMIPATTASDAIADPLPTDTPGVYHFRLVVMNSAGTATGADQTFTVAPVLSGLRVHVRHRRRGDRITYTEAFAGTTTFFFERKVHHHWVQVGRQFEHQGSAGVNKFRSRRKLKPGAYRLVAIPTVNGVTGPQVIVSFRIVAPRRH